MVQVRPNSASIACDVGEVGKVRKLWRGIQVMTLCTQAVSDGLRPVGIDKTKPLPAYDGLEQKMVTMMSYLGDICQKVEDELR